jgi:hypothetical protein
VWAPDKAPAPDRELRRTGGRLRRGGQREGDDFFFDYESDSDYGAEDGFRDRREMAYEDEDEDLRFEAQWG